MQDKFLIIADDFTGANDTGVQLKRNGIPVKVILRTNSIEEKNHSIVIDTESRGLDGDAAYEHVSNMVENVDFSEYDYVIKKVDSTLRGNIAEEIAAVDKKFKSDLIVFAPALPDLNRITINGIHQLNGIPISETEIGQDPKKPVKEDKLVHILSRVFEEKVIHINLYQLQNDFSLDDARIYTFDAEKNSDLVKIISAARKTHKRILWVGTAAMADNLMKTISHTPPALCVCGSVSAVTNQQVKTAEQSGISLVSVSIPDFLNGEDLEGYYVESCVNLMNKGKDVILLSSASYNRAEIDKSIEAGKKKGMALADIGVYTQNTLGEIAMKVLEQVQVSGVFLTGGDTAIGILQKIQAVGSYITEEIAVGIPKMEVIGGKFDGLKVITKAGAFGKDDAIVYGFRKLKEKESEK